MEGMPVRVSVANSMTATSLPVGGVLRQVDGGTHPQGQHNHHGQQHDIEGVEDVGQDADGIVDIAGLGGQQLPGDEGDAPVEDIADDQHQQGAGEEAAKVQQRPQAPVIEPAPAERGYGDLHGGQLLLFPFDEHVEEHVDQHDEQEQHQADGEQGVAVERAHGGVGHLRGDGGGQKPHRRQQARHIGHVAGHHDDGHGLADGPADAQHDGGGDAAAGGGHADPKHRLDVGGPQGQGRLLILPGHGLQGRLRHGDDGGQDHHGQHDDGRQERGAGGQVKGHPDGGHQQDHAHQAIHHRGDARQQLHRRVDHGGEPGRRHLGQEDGRHAARWAHP